MHRVFLIIHPREPIILTLPSGASCLTAQPSHLVQLLDHIQGSYEVAFVASVDQVCVRTFRSDEQMLNAGAAGGGAGQTAGSGDPPGSAVLSTEMTVSATEFDGYVFAGEEDEVTMLKEAVLLLGRRVKRCQYNLSLLSSTASRACLQCP